MPPTPSTIRLLTAASLCAAALLCTACNKDETPAPAPTPAPTAANSNPIGAAVNTAVNDAAKAAQAKVDEITQYVKDNKVEAADKALAELETNKTSLPAKLQEQLPALRKAIDAAKAMGIK